MQISQIIGGYTLGGADLLRRAMGKKKPEEMAKHKNLFVEGALKKGYAQELAENLFDLMAKFAEYGFNKSHSAAYAVVSYHTAYLKAHYLTCFMAATLSSELDKTDKLYEFYQDCLENDIQLLAPDINTSEYRFVAIDDKSIRYALGAIKGVGRNVVDLILAERDKNGEFISFVDFCSRLDKKVANKKTLESLVKAGAFDNLDANRAKLFNNIPKVMDYIETERQNANQGSLFDLGMDEDAAFSDMVAIELDDYAEWSLKEQLHMEKQAMGFYFSASLFDEYKDLVNKLGMTSLARYSLDNEEMQELINSRSYEKPQVLICGIINYLGSRPMKKGGKMVFVNIEDDAHELEFVVFNAEFEKYKHLLKMDEMVFVSGEVIFDSFRNQIKVTAKQIFTLEEILQQQISKVTLQINEDFPIENFAAMLNNEGAKVVLNYSNPIAKCKLELSGQYKFVPNYANLSQINQLLGRHGWSLN
jgi:DNA polymerase-3 subunit alpha